MTDLVRPVPDEPISNRFRSMVAASRSRSWVPSTWAGRVRETDRFGALLFVLAAAGTALVVAGGLWAWQAWQSSPSVPIDDLIPPLDARGQTGSEGQLGAEALDPPASGETGSPTVSPEAPKVGGGASNAIGAGAVGAESLSTSEGPGTTAVVPIRVHVSGAVVSAGVVVVGSDTRIVDAIAAAGGATPDADLDRLNLAAPVHDGDRIHVPAYGEDAVPSLVEPLSAGSGFAEGAGTDGGGATAASDTGSVRVLDLNRASRSDLETLPGIGPTIATAIIGLRDVRGPYYEVDDLLDVAGIGPSKLERIRPFVTVGAN